MCRLKLSDFMLSLAAALGMASFTHAQDAPHVLQADAIFNSRQEMLIKQINNECGPVACDSEYTPCDGLGCDSSGCGLFSEDGFDLSDSLFGEDSDIDVGGWVQLGYTNKSTGLFNTNPHKLNLHQSWLYVEKVADGSEGVGFGFRGDFMYGTDANDTQSFGNRPGNFDFDNTDPGFWANHGIYGFAIPQLYAEMAVGDLSIKAGHFYTLLGYEVVTAPDNFFFSHAFTMYNSEAFTHTGVLATYSASDDVTLYGGWTLGWDTGFDQNNRGNNFLGGASVGVTDELTVTFITTFGNFGAIGSGGYSHSLVADYAISEKLNYVFQTDVLDVAGTETIGANNYLIYSVSDKIGVGGRAEWWKRNGTSYYALTSGVNIKPTANLTFRPEVRYQWSPVENDLAPALQSFPMDQGLIFGMDAIYTF